MALSHSPRIVTDGLVFCVDAGDGKSYPGSGSTWTDRSGNSLNGTLTNGASFSSGEVNSMSFDGSDDRVVVDTGNILGTFVDWSVDIWVKWSNSGYTGWMMLVDQATYGVYQKNIMVWLSSTTDSKRVAMYHGAWVYSSSYIDPNVWTHVLCTKEGQDAKMYINGELDKSATLSNLTSTVNVTGVFGIGGHANNTSYRLNGDIGSVKVYDKILTADEVLQNFNATRGRFGV